MNAIELLHAVLARVVPEVDLALVKPLHESGFWTLDVRVADYQLSIDWREANGFGLTSDPEHGYGEGSDEVYRDFSTAMMRVIRLIRERLETVPPYPVRIKELREKVGLSQAEVARQMGIQQAAVSRLESRDDSHVATLRSYAQALGGKLVLKVVFADREEEIHLAGLD